MDDGRTVLARLHVHVLVCTMRAREVRNARKQVCMQCKVAWLQCQKPVVSAVSVHA